MEISIDATSGTATLNISGTFIADELRDVLEAVRNARAQLVQEPANPIGQNVAVFRDVRWYTEAVGDAAALLFLIPGLGWTGGTLTARDRVLLAHYLMGQQANAMQPATAATASATPTAASSGGSVLH